MKCPKCKNVEMQFGYCIKGSLGQGCLSIAPMNFIQSIDDMEFDIVHKCPECGHSIKMDDKKKEHYLNFVNNYDKISESLSEDFVLKLKEMNPEDIKKLSWFVSSGTLSMDQK
jgi:hypothetical protein